MAKKKPKSEKMYKDSPELKRDDESGEMAVKRPAPKEEAKAPETVADMQAPGASFADGVPANIRQAYERREMNNRHENEHAMVDAGGGSDKKEMMARHLQEAKDMAKRHAKEAVSKDNESDEGDE